MQSTKNLLHSQGALSIRLQKMRIFIKSSLKQSVIDILSLPYYLLRILLRLMLVSQVYLKKVLRLKVLIIL